jgi:hypothetical protein
MGIRDSLYDPGRILYRPDPGAAGF